MKIAMFLLALFFSSACAGANNWALTAPPPGGGKMPADMCRAMDYALGQQSITSVGWSQTTGGPCGADVVPQGTPKELVLLGRPAALSGKVVSASIYYSSKAPVRLYLGPASWVGRAGTESISSVELPAAERQRSLVQVQWSTDPTESKTASLKFAPRAGESLGLFTVHAWSIYPFAMPQGTPGVLTIP